jgi:hypothetical protein
MIMHLLFYIGMPVLTYDKSAICLDLNLSLPEAVLKILWCLSVTVVHQQLAYMQIVPLSDTKQQHLTMVYDRW